MYPSLRFRRRHDLTYDGKPVVCLPISDGNVRQRLVVAYATPDLLTVTGKAALVSIRDYFSMAADPAEAASL